MKEYYYDKLLNVKTSGDQKGFNESLHYHRYEPTPYSALEIFSSNYKMKRTDRMVDFGCGKGRLSFYVNYVYNASVVGVEMNDDFYHKAIANQNSYFQNFKNRRDKFQFYHGLAEDYPIDSADNRFYFFNPFSIQVFRIIINNILISVEKAERDIELILYYPSDDYIYFLENQTLFDLKEEVTLPGLSEHNPYERFLIYRLSYY
ncbi:class I SAM-dependent methyltransferase [Peribacillus saganii]|uniref:Class I SAM-dependent methyltransferase n=1 Tax=Peribacillus saganii TaxID=2303992 RepID=A0A372LP07_9BACI|nr:class I SAM-dependent methyltransferase [Peribacillus saganii]RFU68952.1 class I SAM-dependent methyltransferase [Peribacillus saganii]